MRTPLGTTGATRVPWPLVTIALFGGGLVFAAIAIDHRLDSWDGTYPTSTGYDTHQGLDETFAHIDQLMFRGAVTTVVLLASTSPFVALRRSWAAALTTCLAVASVPMAILFGVLQPSSHQGRKPYSDSDWASFCSATAAPIIVIGAIGTLVALLLRWRREHPDPPDRPAPRPVDRT
jgi:hypothetical protein